MSYNNQRSNFQRPIIETMRERNGKFYCFFKGCYRRVYYDFYTKEPYIYYFNFRISIIDSRTLK